MKGEKALFSSGNDKYITPPWLRDFITEKYGKCYDPCPMDWDPERNEDGLGTFWMGNVYVNPPYSNIGEWVQKCYTESLQEYNKRVILLIPSRTETKYWQNYVMNASEIFFFTSRLKFSELKNSAPFPSSLVIFDKQKFPRLGSITVPGAKDA